MAITAQKFLPQGKTGGDLTVTPKTSLIKSPKEGSNIVFTIQKKIILVDDLLKGTLAEKKERQKKEVKKKEDDQRAKQEADQEKPDTEEEEGNKLVMPRLSFLDGIKNFLSDVLVGWLTFRLIKFLPQIMKVLKILGPIADFLLFIGGKLLDGLVTLIDWGYKAVEGTRGFVKNIFGEKGAKAFDNITGHLSKLFNVIGDIALGVLAVGNQSKKQKQDEINKRTKKKPKLKERYERRQKFKKKNKLKNNKLKKPNKNTLKNKLSKSNKLNAKLNKQISNLTKANTQLKTNLSKATNNFKNQLAKANKLNTKLRTDLSKNLKSAGTNLKTAGTNLKTNLKTTGTQLKTNLKTAGTNLKTQSSKVSKSVGKVVNRLGMKMNKGMVQNMKGLSKMAKGVRIPIVGPLIAALFSYLADGKWDKALFVGIGTALGEMLGTAIPIPVLGTVLGGLIGFYIGDLLFTLFRGGGINEVITKLKGDLVKALNVGKTVGKWANTGFDRLIKGIPTVKVPLLGEVLNPVWIANPANIVAKAKLIGKAFLSRDPMKEEKDEDKVEKKEKISMKREVSNRFDVKTGKMYINNQEVDMEEYNKFINLSQKEKISQYGQVKGNSNNIVSTNGISNKVNNISTYDGDEETVVIKSGSDTGDVALETETKESLTAVVGSGGGGDSEVSDALYKSG